MIDESTVAAHGTPGGAARDGGQEPSLTQGGAVISALDKVEDPYELLRLVVARFHDGGRVATSTNLGPVLQVCGFVPSSAGFDRLRDFIEHAADKGYVKLSPRGGDVEVTPIDSDSAGTSADGTQHARPIPVRHESAASTTRIRDDIWKAAIDWTSSPKYLNRDTGAIHAHDEVTMLSAEAEPRLVEIPRMDAETMRLWMTDFVNSRKSEIHDMDPITEAITECESYAGMGAFSRVLTAVSPNLAQEWLHYRAKATTSRITNWASRNELEDWLWRDLSRRPRPPLSSPQGAPLGSGRGNDLLAIRSLCKAAIDRMTVAQLLALPLPLEHILPRIES